MTTGKHDEVMSLWLFAFWRFERAAMQWDVDNPRRALAILQDVGQLRFYQELGEIF